MKPAQHNQPQKKISKKDLRKEPEWLTDLTKRIQGTAFANMSDEEIGQYTEELAERGAKKRQNQAHADDFATHNSKVNGPITRDEIYPQ